MPVVISSIKRVAPPFAARALIVTPTAGPLAAPSRSLWAAIGAGPGAAIFRPDVKVSSDFRSIGANPHSSSWSQK